MLFRRAPKTTETLERLLQITDLQERYDSACSYVRAEYDLLDVTLIGIRRVPYRAEELLILGSTNKNPTARIRMTAALSENRAIIRYDSFTSPGNGFLPRQTSLFVLPLISAERLTGLLCICGRKEIKAQVKASSAFTRTLGLLAGSIEDYPYSPETDDVCGITYRAEIPEGSGVPGIIERDIKAFGGGNVVFRDDGSVTFALPDDEKLPVRVLEVREKLKMDGVLQVSAVCADDRQTPAEPVGSAIQQELPIHPDVPDEGASATPAVPVKDPGKETAFSEAKAPVGTGGMPEVPPSMPPDEEGTAREVPVSALQTAMSNLDSFFARQQERDVLAPAMKKEEKDNETEEGAEEGRDRAAHVPDTPAGAEGGEAAKTRDVEMESQQEAPLRDPGTVTKTEKEREAGPEKAAKEPEITSAGKDEPHGPEEDLTADGVQTKMPSHERLPAHEEAFLTEDPQKELPDPFTIGFAVPLKPAVKRAGRAGKKTGSRKGSSPPGFQ